MTDSHPQVEDEVERALRLGLAAAAQMADRIARARQELARRAQHRSDQDARQLAGRFRAEGASAVARLAAVDRPEWWDRADAGQIAGLYELAAQWQQDQPRAAAAVEVIARQVQDRYGVDLHAPGAGAADVRAVLARVELERATQTPAYRDDVAAAVAAVLRAEQRDAALAPDDSGGAGGQDARTPVEPDAPAADARSEAVTQADEVASSEPTSELTPDSVQPAGYDSPGRRGQTAAGLREAGLSEESVAVAMRADVAHARPGAEAVRAGNQTASVHSSSGGRSTRSTQRADRSR